MQCVPVNWEWEHYKQIHALDDVAGQSPVYPLATISSISESSSDISFLYPELSNVKDPYTALMMIERTDLREFTAATPYQCHLIGKNDKMYASDFNNILHLSWTMHYWLDGGHDGHKKLPSIKVTAVGREEAERKKLRDGAEVDTTKVFIKIWSANAGLMRDLEGVLKEGSYV